jgi:diguanylate cyclase (GGDEF)-like protein
MALVAMVLAGSLLLAGLFALRAHIGSNLELTARSVAYSVEAALVFRDAEDAQQTLARMLANEGVAQAQVRDAQGKVFAQWQRSAAGPRARLGATLARLVGSQQAVAPILFGGVAVGQVALHGDGQGMLNFLLSGVAVLLLCTAISGAVGMALSRRMLRDIVTPLQALARVARAVHHEHAVGQRVPPARLAELRMLGDDFNALLDELERRQSLLEEKNAQLTHSALHDSLTGLPNRAHFEHFLQEALARAHASAQPMALLFLDNDGFKQVNDTYGHAAGDVLLAEVARRVQAQLRPGDLAARLGGDEFAVVMAPVATLPDAEAMATRLGQAIAAPLRLASGVELHPAASIGVALFPQQGSGMEALLRAADVAMYHVNDFDSDALQGQRRASVLKMGRALVEVGVQTLRVEGHTDDQGSDAYNERLSLRRAQAVAQALAEAGMERGHISVRGYGRSRPLVTSGPEGARKENRRVAIIVPAQ